MISSKLCIRLTGTPSSDFLDIKLQYALFYARWRGWQSMKQTAISHCHFFEVLSSLQCHVEYHNVYFTSCYTKRAI